MQEFSKNGSNLYIRVKKIFSHLILNHKFHGFMMVIICTNDSVAFH